MKALMLTGWKRVVSMPYTAILAFIAGVFLVLASPNFMGPALGAWDELFPVLKPVRADLVSRVGDEVVVSIIALKLKGPECKALRLYGYGVSENGVFSLATVRRPNGDEPGQVVHDAGLHDFGRWLIKPTSPEAVRVEVFVEHNCLGRIVKSKLAGLTL